MDYYKSTATANLMAAVAGEPDGIPIVDHATDNDFLFRWRDPDSGKVASRGHDPAQYVPDMMAAPLQMKTYDPGSWDALYDEQEARQSSLEHLYLEAGWENLDQNGQGYCWSYSTGHANMLRRLALHLPHIRLNPHSVAAIVKNGRDEGGWCGLSLAKQREIGCAEEGTGPGQWPKGSMDPRRFNDPLVKALMLRVQITDDWYDLGKPVYSQTLKATQIATCTFNNCPVPSDWNPWSHSVATVRWVRVAAGHWAPLILNSWKGWGRRGLAVLAKWNAVTVAAGVQAHVPDGAVSVVNSQAA